MPETRTPASAPPGPPRLLLPALGWMLVAALGYLLLLGPSLGTSAPMYSSLRTDPQGASALFGAYARAGLRVGPGYTPDYLDSATPSITVVFVLQPQEWPSGLSGRIAAFAASGGEVVLAGPMLPTPTPPPPVALARPNRSKAAQGAGKAPTPKPPANLFAPPPEPTLAERLGVKLIAVNQALPAALPSDALLEQLGDEAKAIPLLHPKVALLLGPGWTPLYRRDNPIYVAMRPWGKGRVIVASEATFLSNDNLSRAPDAALLSWLVHGRSVVWADETTHGLQDYRGTAWLLRRYHLQAAVLLLLLGLGVAAWSVAATLERAPQPDARAAMEESVPLPASVGLARLLRRALPLGDLIETCRGQAGRRDPELRRRLPPTPAGHTEDDILEYDRQARAALAQGAARPLSAGRPPAGRAALDLRLAAADALSAREPRKDLS